MRHGFVFPAIILTSAAAGVLVMAIIGSAAARAREARLHQARVQGREWCLGAQSLPASEFAIGAWRIRVDAAHATAAVGPLGTYRIAADGRETWVRETRLHEISRLPSEARTP